MADMSGRQPAADEPSHSFPQYATSLAPSAQYVVPEVAHSETKVSQSVPVARYSFGSIRRAERILLFRLIVQDRKRLRDRIFATESS